MSDLIEQITKAYFNYQDVWGVAPNLLFVGKRAFNELTYRLNSSYNFHDVKMMQNERKYFDADVYFINSPSCDSFYWLETDDIEKAIKLAQGLPSKDYQIDKIEMLEVNSICLTNQNSLSRQTIKDIKYIDVPKFAVEVYIQENAKKSNGLSFLKDKSLLRFMSYRY